MGDERRREPRNRSDDDQMREYSSVDHPMMDCHDNTGDFGGPHKDPDNNADDKVHLKRQIGLFPATCLVIGSIIGVGIFISPRGVLRHTQSVGMSLVIWALCGVISLLGGLCYAELGTMLPRSGGEYVFLYTAFGSAPAFLFSWVSNLMVKPAGNAIGYLSFAHYVLAPFFEGSGVGCDPPGNGIKLIAICFALLLATINAYSVKLSTNFNNVFTVSKMIPLIIIIVVGFMRLSEGHTENLDLDTSFDNSASTVFSYGVAFYQGLFSYDNWNALPHITEELINPSRNLPLAIVLAVPTVTVLYLLTNIAYFTVMSPEELMQSLAVAVTFSNRTLGAASWIIPLGVIFSTLGMCLAGFLFCVRLPYVVAREGHLPELLAMVHVRRYTPVPSIVFLATLCTLMLLPGTIDSLMNYFSFVVWLTYGSSFVALLWLRYRHPEWKRPIKVPILIPILMVLVSLYLVVAPIIDNPSYEFLYAVLFIFLGLLAYFPLVYYQYRPPFTDRVTRYLQILLEVAPSGYNE